MFEPLRIAGTRQPGRNNFERAYKFVKISPENLGTRRFRSRIHNIKIYESLMFRISWKMCPVPASVTNLGHAQLCLPPTANVPSASRAILVK